MKKILSVIMVIALLAMSAVALADGNRQGGIPGGMPPQGQTGGPMMGGPNGGTRPDWQMPNGQTVTRQSNNELPVAQEVVDAFVDRYKGTHPGREYSVTGELSEAQKAQALRETSDDYQSALERGDMKAAQEDVESAAEQAGYTIKVYHGTANGGAFTVFDPSKLSNSSRLSRLGQGFYFTDSKSGAKEYTSQYE